MGDVVAVIYPTVLIADDSSDTRQMLRQAFELKGYSVLEAANGQEALDITKKFCPNLIVVDLNMPKLDGLETVRYVRELKGSAQQVPILCITAFDVYGMEEAALATGCNQYLSKPIDLHELDRVLRGLGFLI
jgi:two-component system cell cycle response regulator DivK